MKAKKVFKILCVVFAVLFACTVIGGVVYGCIQDRQRRSNSISAVVGYEDNHAFKSQKSNDNARSLSNTAVAPLAETPTNGTFSCKFTVRIFKPDNTELEITSTNRVTLWGTNGSRYIKTLVTSSSQLVTLTTQYQNGAILNYSTVTYGYGFWADAVYCSFRKFEGNLTFPLICTEAMNGGQYVLELTLDINEPYNDIYNAGYEEGHGVGLSAGYSSGYEEGQSAGYSNGREDGIAQGYENGYDEGYNIGLSEGHSDGYSSGYDAGETTGYHNGYETGKTDGYNEGYTNGLNKGQSAQLTNPISAFLTPVHNFMTTPFFGSLTYASIFNVVLFVAVAIIFIKMFSGG